MSGSHGYFSLFFILEFCFGTETCIQLFFSSSFLGLDYFPLFLFFSFLFPPVSLCSGTHRMYV